MCLTLAKGEAATIKSTPSVKKTKRDCEKKKWPTENDGNWAKPKKNTHKGTQEKTPRKMLPNHRHTLEKWIKKYKTC